MGDTGQNFSLSIIGQAVNLENVKASILGVGQAVETSAGNFQRFGQSSSQAASSFGAVTQGLAQGKTALDSFTTSEERLSSTFGQNVTELDRLAGSVQNYGHGLDSTNTLTENLSNSTSGMSGALRNVQTNIDANTNSWSSHFGSISQNVAQFGFAAGAIIGLVVQLQHLEMAHLRVQRAEVTLQGQTISVQTAFNNLTDAQAKYGAGSAEASLAADKLQKAQAAQALTSNRLAFLRQREMTEMISFGTQVVPTVIGVIGSLAQTYQVLAQVLASTSFAAQTLKFALIGTGIGAVAVIGGTIISYLLQIGQATQTFGKVSADSYEEAALGASDYADTVAETAPEVTAGIGRQIEGVTVLSKLYGESLTEAALTAQKQVQQTNQMVKQGLEFQLNYAKSMSAGLDPSKGGSLLGEMLGFGKSGPTIDLEKKKWEAEVQRLEGVLKTVNPTIDANTESINANVAALENASMWAHKWADVEMMAQTDVAGTVQIQSNMYAMAKAKADEWWASIQPFLKTQPYEVIKQSYQAFLDTLASPVKEDAISILGPKIDALDPKVKETTKSSADLINKLKELEAKFGIDLPDSVAATDQSLQAAQKDLQDFQKFAEELSKPGPLEKTFKLKDETDKDLKTFIKKLHDKSADVIELNIDTKRADVRAEDFFNNIKLGIFKATDTGVAYMGKVNDKIANDYAKTMADMIEKFFKGTKMPEKWQKLHDTLLASIPGDETKDLIIKALTDAGFLDEVESAGGGINERIMAGMKKKYQTPAFTNAIGDVSDWIISGGGAGTGGGDNKDKDGKDAQSKADTIKTSLDSIGTSVDGVVTKFGTFDSSISKSLAHLQNTARGFAISMNTYFANTVGGAVTTALTSLNTFDTTGSKDMTHAQTTARGFAVSMNTYFGKTIAGAVDTATGSLDTFATDGRKDMVATQTTARGFAITMNTYFGSTIKGAVDAATTALKNFKKAIDAIPDKTTKEIEIKYTQSGSPPSGGGGSSGGGGGGRQYGGVDYSASPVYTMWGEGPEIAAFFPLDKPQRIMGIMASLFKTLGNKLGGSAYAGRGGGGGGAGGGIIHLHQTEVIQIDGVAIGKVLRDRIFNMSPLASMD